MKIEKQFTEDHQVKLTVEVEPEPLEAAKHKAARQIAKRTKIPGFRPGKAPYPVIERYIGEANILEEALDLMIQDLYPKIIEEAEIKPYGPGKLESMPSMDPPTFEFTVPLDAEVTLSEYSTLRFPYELKEVTDEAVENVIQDLRDRQAILEPVDRPAEEGDVVYLHVSGERREAEEGKPLSLVEDRPYSTTLRPQSEENNNEWPFPGFSSQLIGLTSGDEKTIEHTFTDETPFETLRGVDAIFRLKVDEVKSRSLPDLTDEFAQSMGEFENMEALRKEVRSNLEEQNKSEYESSYTDQIVNNIVENSTIKYPPQMLENEVDMFVHQLEHRLADQNLDMDIYLKSRQMTMDDLKNEIQPSAETRLRRSLILYEIARVEDIQVEEKDVQSEAVRTLGEYSQMVDQKEFKKVVNNNFIQNMVSNITADMLVRKTLDRLKAIAKGEYPPEETPSEETGSEESPSAETADIAPDSEASEQVVETTETPITVENSQPTPETDLESGEE